MDADRGLPGRILMLGLMAAGKSTIGRALAARLGRQYLDNDAMLRELTGVTLQQFAAGGIAALHRAEGRVLRAVLGTQPPWVASAAASVVLDADSVTALRQSDAVTVWIRASPATLAAHAGSGRGRPLLGADPIAVFTAMVEQRSPAFAEVADITVDIDGRSVDAITGEIVDRLRTSGGADAGGTTARRST